MNGDKPDLEKQFDALVAQLPRRRRRRRRRALPWIIGLLAAFGISALLFVRQQPSSKGPRVNFPLAVCGNGKVEPGEDCELDQANCPADCIQRAESVESTSPAQDGKRKE